jgi:ATP-binding cassette subfamily F protein 3
MLKLTDLALQRGGRTLFDGLECSLHAGNKCAIVGRNGIGKSTLFGLLLGSLQPERGSITRNCVRWKRRCVWPKLKTIRCA